MASPFSVFRKYMKPMMVVLCGMAMLAFVVVDPLMQYLGTSARGSGAGPDGSQVVVTWNDGELTEDELSALVYRRRILDAFVRRVYEQGTFAAYLEGAEDLQLSVDPLVLPIEPSQGVERDVVISQIVADKAHDLGMAVSDEAALDYLDKLGRNRVTFQEMNTMIGEMFSQQQITSQFVLDALRYELLKQNFLASYKFSVATQLPEQRWHDWLQVNDRVIVEAAGLKSSDFIAQVEDPTDPELLAFYEEYKDDEATPDFPLNTELPSAKPGFRVPRHLQVQYLEGKFDDVLQQAMTTVTDEEISKFYDANKELFIRADSGAAAVSSPVSGVESAPTSESTEGTTPPIDSTKELFGTPSVELPADTPPESGAGSAPAEDPTPPAAESETSDGDQSSVVDETTPFRLVAFQEEAAPQQPVAEESTAQPADASASDVPATETAPPADNPPANESTTEAASSAESESTATDIPKTPAVEYQPLEEVREEIRRRLAGDKVNQQLSEKMKSLLSKLNAAYLPYFDKQLSARADDQPVPEPPAELKDLQALAGPNGFQYHDTGDVSVWEFRKMPLAQTLDADESADPRLPLLILALQRLKNYEPVVTRDLDGNQYLAMKTLDTPGYVPKLEDVRDQVVQAWKEQKASELALAKAKEIAAQIEKDGVSLGDKFANDPAVEVVVTDPFSYLTYGEISPTTRVVPFRLSDPKPIVAAGPGFMEAVFQLDDGKVGAVLNHDHSIAYIVRMQQHLENRESLQKDFLQEMAIGWMGATTMARGHAQMAQAALFQGLSEESGITWKRTADQLISDQTDEQ